MQPTPFVGKFFFCTNFSLFRVTVPLDLRNGPEVMKMSTHVLSQDLGRDLRIPVGGIMRYGTYVGITARGVFKYDTGQRIDKDITESPIRLEQLPSHVRGLKKVQSKTVVGIFLRASDAEDCFAAVKVKPRETFTSDWWNETRDILTRIGTNHPLISISTENKFAVPKWLYDENTPFPVAPAI